MGHPFGWWARPRADWHTVHAGPEELTVTYTDGHEWVARDARGRVTRHIVARAGRPFVDRCYKFVREGGKSRRVEITAEEWEEMRKPKPPRKEKPIDGTPTQRRGNAAGVDENDWSTY